MARERAGLTLRDAAKRLTEVGGSRVSYQAVSNWERGQTGTPMDRLPVIAKVYGCTQEFLMGVQDVLGDPAMPAVMLDKARGTLFNLEQAIEELGIVMSPAKKAAVFELLLKQEADAGYIRSMLSVMAADE